MHSANEKWRGWVGLSTQINKIHNYLFSICLWLEFSFPCGLFLFDPYSFNSVFLSCLFFGWDQWMLFLMPSRKNISCALWLKCHSQWTLSTTRISASRKLCLKEQKHSSCCFVRSVQNAGLLHVGDILHEWVINHDELGLAVCHLALHVARPGWKDSVQLSQSWSGIIFSTAVQWRHCQFNAGEIWISGLWTWKFLAFSLRYWFPVGKAPN